MKDRISIFCSSVFSDKAYKLSGSYFPKTESHLKTDHFFFVPMGM